MNSSSQNTSHLRKQAVMLLATHGLTISAHTAGRVLGLSTGTRINDMFSKQQATNQRKTVILLTLACFYTCHLRYLEKHGNLCPICKDPFLKRLNNLTDSLNKRLLCNIANKNSCSNVESTVLQ